MRRSRWTRIGILVAALSIAVTACGGGDDDAASGSGTGGGPANKTDDFVIGVSNTLAGNGWREQMICSVKAQALASGKVSKVIAISKNGGPTEQIQDLQNLISQGANAIIVNPSDREKLNPVIQQATQKKIVVVAVDQAVSEPTAYVATNDQVAYGRLGAEWLADKLGGKGNVLYMRGIDGVPADSDRDKGFQEVIAANPNIKTKEVFTGWDFTKGGDIAVQELTSGNYDGVWTSGIDYTVVNAFKTVGKDPVPVVGAGRHIEVAGACGHGRRQDAEHRRLGPVWAGRGDAAEAGFEADQPGERRRDADRPAAVARRRHRDEAGGHRRRAAAAGTAGRAVGVPGVAGDAERLGLGEVERAELGGGGLADAHHARGLQAEGDRIRHVGHEVGEGR